MPLINITYDSSISTHTLQKLQKNLPHIISVAVACPEEPYDGDLQPGDVDLRFYSRSSFDTGGPPIVIEVYSKFFESRAHNRQERSDRIHNELAAIIDNDFGVYLALPIASWSD
jgi:hypothetical protein